MKRLGACGHFSGGGGGGFANSADSLLRSLLYSRFSETITGLPTIRSYGGTDHFLKDNQYYVDLEDHALF
jgi:hypothetical protein